MVLTESVLPPQKVRGAACQVVGLQLHPREPPLAGRESIESHGHVACHGSPEFHTNPFFQSHFSRDLFCALSNIYLTYFLLFIRKRCPVCTQKNLLCIHKRSPVHAQHSCACSGPGNPGARAQKGRGPGLGPARFLVHELHRKDIARFLYNSLSKPLKYKL